MLHRVALSLGKSVRELSESMDLRELAHWIAFFNLHGYPDMRHEFYGAQLAGLVVSIASPKGKSYGASDFMLDEMVIPSTEKADDELRKHLDMMVAKNAK